MITGSAPTLAGTYTVDNYVLSAGDRVLVNSDVLDGSSNYVSGGNAANGIYVVGTGSWVRAEDMDQTTPLNEVNSSAVFVENGDMFADSGWVQVNAVSALGTDLIKFVQFNGAASITAGAGLTKTGNTLDVGAVDSTITVEANGIKVSDSYTTARDSVATSAVTSLSTAASTAISSEASVRASADSSLASRLSSEESARASGDTSLESRLSVEESNRTSGDSSLTSRVSTEESARASADTSLESRLSSEESARASGDSSLASRVSTEESARASGDSSLTSRISSEESARASGDASVLSSANSYSDSKIAALVDSAPELL
ncbi:MAG: hypothetical protein EB023_10795, partial [Flavobacteriia bacterium]|nr:hypothetical protein [Flavobacteriia bacterium]